MVLYFSATGNTEFIAKEIAKRTDDECVNLLTRIKEQDYTPIHSDKPFVICAPVYVCEILNILVRRSRRSGVARATIPDLGSHHLLLI